MFTKTDYIPEGIANPNDVAHIAKMLCCHIWQGNLDGISIYVKLFKAITKRDRSLIEAVPDPFLGIISQAIKTLAQGKIPTPWIPKACFDPIRVSLQIPIDYNESDIVKAFVSSSDAMDMIAKDDRIVTVEHRVSVGRIDVRVAHGKEVHAIEFKARLADHECVGQIQKYMRELGSRIHYGLYDHVIGWVVAPDFTPDTLIALGQIGVHAVRVIPKFSS